MAKFLSAELSQNQKFLAFHEVKCGNERCQKKLLFNFLARNKKFLIRDFWADEKIYVPLKPPYLPSRASENIFPIKPTSKNLKWLKLNVRASN